MCLLYEEPYSESIPGKHGCSVCIANYGHMNVVSPIHSEHSGVRTVNKVAEYDNM